MTITYNGISLGTVTPSGSLPFAHVIVYEPAEARALLSRFEGWLNVQQFATWQDKVFWGLLHQEARRLILTMPRASR